MKNRYFSQSSLRVLLDPDRWRLACTALSLDEKTTLPDRRFLKWYSANSENHSFAEIAIVLEGNAYYRIAEKVFHTTPGTILFIKSGEIHQSGYPGFYPDVLHLWIRLLKNHFTAHISCFKNGKFSLHDVMYVAHPLMTDVPDLGESEDGFVYRKLVKMHLLSSAMEISCSLVEQGYMPEVEKKDKMRLQGNMIEVVQQHIRDTAGKGVNLKSLSQITGYSTFHFLRVFKKETGRTVQEFVETERIRKMREMTAHGAMAKEISETLGFSCPASYSRWSRKFRIIET